jgi:hypothetical protein
LTQTNIFDKIHEKYFVYKFLLHGSMGKNIKVCGSASRVPPEFRIGPSDAGRTGAVTPLGEKPEEGVSPTLSMGFFFFLTNTFNP